jgi:bifunctional non-homologous end joining protein LigD
MSKTIDSADLFFKSGSSDKEYHLQLVEDNGGYLVNFQYGRRGSTLNPGCKTKAPVSLEAARKVFNKIVAEKTSEGYTVGASTGGDYTSAAAKPTTPLADRVIPQLLNPIGEDEVERYLRDDSWGAQEKKDGKHQMIHKTASTITATNKKGIEIGYPTAYADGLPQVGLYDGEAIGDSYHVFDLLEYDTKDLRLLGYGERYKYLEGMLKDSKGSVKLVPLVTGYVAKKALYDRLRAEKKEGIVFKKLSAKFTPGRPSTGGDMVKLKFYAEASCIVAAGREGKRSVGLELIDGAGKRVSVGNVTITPNKDVPKVGAVVEIRYLYAYMGGSLYQPQYKEPRDDIDVAECLMTQLKYKAEED